MAAQFLCNGTTVFCNGCAVSQQWQRSPQRSGFSAMAAQPSAFWAQLLSDLADGRFLSGQLALSPLSSAPVPPARRTLRRRAPGVLVASASLPFRPAQMLRGSGSCSGCRRRSPPLSNPAAHPSDLRIPERAASAFTSRPVARCPWRSWASLPPRLGRRRLPPTWRHPPWPPLPLPPRRLSAPARAAAPRQQTVMKHSLHEPPSQTRKLPLQSEATEPVAGFPALRCRVSPPDLPAGIRPSFRPGSLRGL